MTRNLLSILTLLVLTTANAQATTYYVATTGNDANPGTEAQPFQTIQRGMDLAQNGDTVLVANGTYSGVGNRTYFGSRNYNLDPEGKNFTLRSQGGATNCIIDPRGDGLPPILGRGFLFVTGETGQMVVDGFTIKRGTAGSDVSSAGGGMAIDGASPTIRNCVFRDNSAQSNSAVAGGGAVFVRDGSPTFTNCSFIENRVVSSSQQPAAGGGIGIQGNSNVTLNGCLFSGNRAENWSGGFSIGGGLFFAGGARATLTDCTFNGNIAGSNYIGVGGGIGIQDSQVVLQNCTLSGNTAQGGAGQAGGVHVQGQNSSLTLTNCSLASNTARGTNGPGFGGGAAATGESQLLLVNTLIVNNHATGTTLAKGGGIVAGNSGTSVRLVHCAVTQNRASGTGSGGGVLADDNGSLSLTNCILYGNHAPTGAEHEAYVGATLTLTYCNIGGYPTTPDANHNFGVEPRFVRNPSWGADGNPGTGDDDPGDLHLQSGSPCIDTGMVSPANGVPYDKDVHNRLVGFAPDLGAYEVGSTLYIAADIYVDTVSGMDLPGRGTPSAPFRTVNMALSRVTAPVGWTVIHVKEGNYGSDRSTITKKVRFVNWGNTGQARIGKYQ